MSKYFNPALLLLVLYILQVMGLASLQIQGHKINWIAYVVITVMLIAGYWARYAMMRCDKKLREISEKQKNM